MIIAIAPKYKFVCDRCGKEKFPNDDGYTDTKNACEIAVEISPLSDSQLKMPKRIQVCRECCDDFETFWENFRDSVNKEAMK